MFVFIAVVLLPLPPLWILSGSLWPILSADSIDILIFRPAERCDTDGRSYELQPGGRTHFAAFQFIDRQNFLNCSCRFHNCSLDINSTALSFITQGSLDLSCRYTLYTMTRPHDITPAQPADNDSIGVVSAVPGCSSLNVHRFSLMCAAALVVLSCFFLFALSFVLGSMWMARVHGSEDGQDRGREDRVDLSPIHSTIPNTVSSGASAPDIVPEPRWRADNLSRLWTICMLLYAMTAVAGLIVVVSVWRWLRSSEFANMEVGAMPGLHTALFVLYTVIVSCLLTVYYVDAVEELKALRSKDASVSISPLRCCS
jgi:hypothetical protein